MPEYLLRSDVNMDLLDERLFATNELLAAFETRFKGHVIEAVRQPAVWQTGIIQRLRRAGAKVSALFGVHSVRTQSVVYEARVRELQELCGGDPQYMQPPSKRMGYIKWQCRILGCVMARNERLVHRVPWSRHLRYPEFNNSPTTNCK